MLTYTWTVRSIIQYMDRAVLALTQVSLRCPLLGPFLLRIFYISFFEKNPIVGLLDMRKMILG